MLLERWRAKRRLRQAHDSTAFNCQYWTGDRAGYRLSAVCELCPDWKVTHHVL